VWIALPWGREVILFALLGMAAAGTVESETILQVRHDYFGEPFVPLYQAVRVFERAGSLDVTAFAAGSWEEGLSELVDPEVFLLEVDRRETWGRWSLGRQQALTALRPQTFDGVRLEVLPVEGLSLGAWGGVARHHDLDDLEDGVGLARAESRYRRGGVALKAGVEISEDPSLGGAIQEDAEARVQLGSQGMPEARGLVVLTGDELRWGKLSLSGNLVSGARLTVDAERRNTEDTTDLLGEALVAVFAVDAVDAWGVGLRLSDRTWSALSIRYAFDRYEQVDGEVYGHGVDASWMKATHATFRVVPAYRFRAGPGGMFHAAYATADWALSDATHLIGTAAWVPYRKLHDPWTSATSLGLSVSQEIARRVTVSGGVEGARDALYALDLRGTARLLVTL
jgi:hypothetical protein